MRRCSSAPTTSKRAGTQCSRSSMPGRTIRRKISRTMPPAAMARRRPTSCWRAMAALGGPSIDRTHGGADGRKTQDLPGGCGCRRHPRHGTEVLTQRAQAAVQALHRAGIRFAITSGRPPRGMAMLFDALDLETPIAGFNGGLFIRRDLSILEQKTVEPDIARQAVALIREHGLDAWIYSGNDWLITKPGAPHVAREAWTVKV